MPIPQPIPQPLCPYCWSELGIALGREIHACAVGKVTKREIVIPPATLIRTQSVAMARPHAAALARPPAHVTCRCVPVPTLAPLAAERTISTVGGPVYAGNFVVIAVDQ